MKTIDRKNHEIHPSKIPSKTGSQKTIFPSQINVKLLLSGKWKIDYEVNHNHKVSGTLINYPALRTKILDSKKSAEVVMKTLISRKTKVSTIRAVMKKTGELN